MGKDKTPEPRFSGAISPGSLRSIRQQLGTIQSNTRLLEAVTLLRSVQVAYGRGSWPKIDQFLDGIDGKTVVEAAR